MILLIIGGLVLGGLFLKYFKRIDTALFGKTMEDYESFGFITVMICMFSGALTGGSSFLNAIAHTGWSVKSTETCSAWIAISAVSYAVYEAVEKMGSVPARIGKICFMILSCAIGMFTGAVGSIAVIILVVLILLLYLFYGMLNPNSNSRIAYNREADDLNWERDQMLGRDNVSKDEADDLKNRIKDHNQRSGKDLLG